MSLDDCSKLLPVTTLARQNTNNIDLPACRSQRRAGSFFLRLWLDENGSDLVAPVLALDGLAEEHEWQE